MNKENKEIEHILKEKRRFAPSKDFIKQANLSLPIGFETLYKQSIDNPETFWSHMAKDHLHWFKKWDSVLSYDFDNIGKSNEPYVKWFEGGKLNVCYNCLDRHLSTPEGRRKTAIIWQGEKKQEKRIITYQELHQDVMAFSSTLLKSGVKKGTVVTIYMPMIPESVIAMLACARIGAIHSVVFSAFSSDSLASRINDGKSEILITSDISVHHGKNLPLKQTADKALDKCASIKKVIVFKRGDGTCPMKSGRDFWWHEEIENSDLETEAVSMDSEDILFMLYTSGSTGKPKAVLHSTAGYNLYTHLSFKYVFDFKPNDIFWCTADIGWITGHSYLVYGPLSNAATVVMYEGSAIYPTPDRFFEIIEEHKVSVFYTAPTAIRAFMSFGEELTNKHDLSSLRLLGSVGEPINPEAWVWYFDAVGKGKCPIVDTWWQTETGGIMITTLSGIHEMKPSSAGVPFFGVQTKIADRKEESEGGGSLLITKPWPSMIRGIHGDENNELLRNVYFSAYPGNYFTGDGCRTDEDGYHWLLGRIDDVINVAGHRFATAEIESAFVAHHKISEAAVVPKPHPTKGQGIYCFITVKNEFEADEALSKELFEHIRNTISPIATPDAIHFSKALPKTRSGKIMRRILRKIAEEQTENLGDITTLADPSVVEKLLNTAPFTR